MSDLLSETLRLAKSSALPAREICTQAKVGYRWYCRFLNGDFADPGVKKVERLHEVLSRTQRVVRPRRTTTDPRPAP